MSNWSGVCPAGTPESYVGFEVMFGSEKVGGGGGGGRQASL